MSPSRIEFARRIGAEAHGCAEDYGPGGTVIAEREPARFMAAFRAAVAAGGNVFVADPAWGPRERTQVAAFAGIADTDKPKNMETRGWLMIPSGGTSGQLKFARHDEETIGAAVDGFTAHFGLERVNALGVLPLHHVSGLMAWMRCALTDGEYVPCDWKKLEAGEAPCSASGGDWVVSLVPTQLQRLMRAGERVDWLRRFRIIFLGGAPAWPALLTQAAQAGLRLAPSYGMTETAAMITALRPAEFLAGNRTCGAALPHVRVRVDDEGRVNITSASMFRGYFPEWRDPREFTAPDIGRIDAQGHLSICGRDDAVIVTGGEKVHPQAVEAALRASGEFVDVAVIGVADPEWGEVVVACYPATQHRPDIARAVVALTPFQRPKRFVAVPEWPRNAQGKVNRAHLLAIAEADERLAT